MTRRAAQDPLAHADTPNGTPSGAGETIKKRKHSMRNSASALALQLCLDFDQPVRPPDPAPDAAGVSQVCEPTLFSLAPSEVLAPSDFSFAAGRMLAS